MKRDEPLVTAIITTRNRLNLLKRAVQSVKDQTYGNLELIVVDDGSTDGTNDWCKNQEFKYIYIDPKESKGGNYARNLGIKAANGEYVAFLDDDDYWLPKKIEKQVTLSLESDCGVIHCGKRLEVIHGDKIEYIDSLPSERNTGDLSRCILTTVCANTSSTFLIDKSLLFDVELFDESLHFWQDYELTIRLAQKSSFCAVDECLCVYRINNKDKDRLTNKFYEWRIAVKYIKNKHRLLYKKLSSKEKLLSKYAYTIDAYNRVKKDGKTHDKILYYLSVLSFKPFVLINYALKLLRKGNE